METTIRLKSSELTPAFVEKLKAFFEKDDELEIAITPISDFGLNSKESEEKYMDRVNRAIKNLENSEDISSFSEDEFESLTKYLLQK